MSKGFTSFRADPFLSQTTMSGVVCMGPVVDLSSLDAQAFVDALNPFLSEFDWELSLGKKPYQWLCKVQTPVTFKAKALSKIVGKDFSIYMPTGPDGLEVQRIATEIQMFLHDHVLNTQRQAERKPVVSGCWFYKTLLG